jgi:lipopolysaccharide export system protein LptA
VVITDGDTEIRAQAARMYERQGVAVITDSVRILSPDALIEADSAFYYLKERRAELYGNVRVHQDSLDILAPLLEYRSSDRLVRAQNGVTLVNPERGFRLDGRRGSYDLGRDIGTVDQSPVLVWERERDSARVTSRQMEWHDKESRALATGSVRLVSGASEVTCDTVVYFAGPDSGLALGSPEVRDSVSHASGQSMAFQLSGGALREVTIRENAAGEYQTEGGDLVEVEGRGIHLWLEGGEIDRIEVTDLGSGRLVRRAEAGAGNPE